MNESIELLIFQLALIFILLWAVIYLVRYNLSIKLKKRITKYSINSISIEQASILDSLEKFYKDLRRLLTKLLLKFKIMERYSLKYNKYIDFFDDKGKLAIDYVSDKILVVIGFIIIRFLAEVMTYKSASIGEYLLIVIIGFYIPDLILIYTNYKKRKKIEHDLLNAIIIMNNAFKSGRSTMQAIEIVNKELEGPISKEFGKMFLEITYGLSLEVVFKRFSERIDLEEVSYITSSLTILNKTGGNIVKVFSSIERSLFSKRKLELELKSLTSSSNAMSKSLLVLPFIFSGIILLLNPTYFNPLWETQLGIFIIVIITLFYGLYSYFVRRIMTVRM